MLETLLGVLALALLDAVNPSALAVTVFLLLQGPGYPSRVLAYVGGIFVTYTALGVLLLLGVTVALDRFGYLLETTASYAVQGVLGAALAAYGFWPRRAADGDGPGPGRRPRSATLTAVFGLGMLISLVESSTAAPYLAAVGILGTSGFGTVWALGVLVAYNLVMITPPVLVIVAYRVFGARLEPRLRRAEAWLRAKAQETFLAIIGAVGVLLLLNSLRHFEVHRLFGG